MCAGDVNIPIPDASLSDFLILIYQEKKEGEDMCVW